MAEHRTYTQGEFAAYVGSLESREDVLIDSKTLRSIHAALGMAGEVGELVDHVKKTFVYRGFNFDRLHVIEELGDLFHYMTMFMNIHNITLDDIRDANIRKLQARYPEGYTHERAIHRNVQVEQEATGRKE